MKKLTLLVSAAALVLPAAALAKTHNVNQSVNRQSSNQQTYTYQKVEPASGNGEYRIEMQSEQDFRDIHGRNATFALADGEKLQIDGDTVYKVASNGDRFYAPNGSYETRNGQSIVVDDGRFVRIEKAPEIVSLDMNDKNHRRY